MTGPFAQSLIRLEGPVVPWQSPDFTPVPNAGAGHDIGLAVGNNRGMFGSYIRRRAALNNYEIGDVLQLNPDFIQPVGSPGGQLATRMNPSRLTTRVNQGIYATGRTGSGSIALDGSDDAIFYRALLASGSGPYGSAARGRAPAGPLVAGETAEFPLSGSFAEVANPAGVEPFMWTLYGRCLAADLGCAPGEVMAFGSTKQNGVVRGWFTSYSRKTATFSLSVNTNTPRLITKSGPEAVPTVASWAFFFRFVGIARAGLPARSFGNGRREAAPLAMWMSPPSPFSQDGVRAFACPEIFSPVLVNSYYLCKTAEYGFGTGDWVIAQEGNNNSQIGGFAATFDGRSVVLAPYGGAAVVQYIHRLDTGAYARMTEANWSWFFLFLG
jgi:hypothetical protein